jgi:hypothetical protein
VAAFEAGGGWPFILEDLKQLALTTQDQALFDMAVELEELLARAEKGEVSKQQLIEKMEALQDRYARGAGDEAAEVAKAQKAVDQQKEKLRKLAAGAQQDEETQLHGVSLAESIVQARARRRSVRRAAANASSAPEPTPPVEHPSVTGWSSPPPRMPYTSQASPCRSPSLSA